MDIRGDQSNNRSIDNSANNADKQKQAKFTTVIWSGFIGERPALIQKITVGRGHNKSNNYQRNKGITHSNLGDGRKNIENDKINRGVDKSNHDKFAKLPD